MSLNGRGTTVVLLTNLSPERNLMRQWIIACMLCANPTLAADRAVPFEHPSVAAADDWLMVDYAIDPAAWQDLRGPGRREVVLRVEEVAGTMTTSLVYTIALDDRVEVVQLPLPRAMDASVVELSVHGRVGSDRLVGVSLGRQGGPSVRLGVTQVSRAAPLSVSATITPARPGVSPGRTSVVVQAPAAQVVVQAPPQVVMQPVELTCAPYDVATVIAACDDALVGGSDQRACLVAAQQVCGNPVPLISACDDALVGGSDVIGCIKAGAGAPQPNPAVVQACGDELVGGSDVLTCVSLTHGFVADPIPSVRACADGLVGGGDINSCLRMAQSSAVDPSPAIQACADANVGGRDMLDCIQLSVR